MPQCRQTAQTAWQWSDDDRGLLDGLFNALKIGQRFRKTYNLARRIQNLSGYEKKLIWAKTTTDELPTVAGIIPFLPQKPSAVAVFGNVTRVLRVDSKFLVWNLFFTFLHYCFLIVVAYIAFGISCGVKHCPCFRRNLITALVLPI